MDTRWLGDVESRGWLGLESSQAAKIVMILVSREHESRIRFNYLPCGQYSQRRDALLTTCAMAAS
jgi:hypothetical protein